MGFPKNIFFDIDDTIVDANTHKIPFSVPSAIEELADAGYKLYIATGRPFSHIPNEVMQTYAWDGYVCSNGQTIINKKKEEIFRISIDKETVKQCIDLANKTHTALEYKCPKGTYLANQSTKEYIEVFKYFGQDPWPYREIEESDQIEALLVSREPGNTYEDFKSIPGIEIKIGQANFADINAESCSKYNGICHLLKMYNSKQYAAIGDSMNDYEMLENANYSIAMGNSPKEIQAICDYVTTSVQNDGIKNAVNWIISQEAVKWKKTQILK